jgi:hypothetical protein
MSNSCHPGCPLWASFAIYPILTRRSLIFEAKKQIGRLAVQGEQQKIEKRHQSQQLPNMKGKTQH